VAHCGGEGLAERERVGGVQRGAVESHQGETPERGVDSRLLADPLRRGWSEGDGGKPGDGDVQRGGEYGLGTEDGGALSRGNGPRRACPPGPSSPERDRGGVGGPWADLVWLPCRDGKARPTQPGIFPLAHGIPNRVGTLRGAGNAIVPQVAAEFVRAYLEVSA
jgi:DNA (cytosine-5)-methyltransferase 1